MSALLSHEETLRLIAAAQAGEEQAKETLIEKNIPLVKSIVKGYLGRGTEYEDLFQLGSMGLLKAILNYDASFNVRFSTYAVPLISGEIKRFLRDDGPIKVSRVLREHAAKAYRAAEQLKKELGRDPTTAELAKAAGLSEEELIECTDASRAPLSIDEPISDDSNATLLDTLSVSEDESTLNRLLVRQLLRQFSPRERQVVMLRYFQDKTQSQIAEIIGVSQVQVSRILKSTLEKLRDAM